MLIKSPVYFEQSINCLTFKKRTRFIENHNILKEKNHLKQRSPDSQGLEVGFKEKGFKHYSKTFLFGRRFNTVI